MSGTYAIVNAGNISSGNSKVIFLFLEHIYPRAKDAVFSRMYDFPDKNIKWTNWSWVFNFFTRCPGFFVPDSEMTNNKGFGLPSILFFHYENASSCFLHKKLLSEDGKGVIYAWSYNYWIEVWWIHKIVLHWNHAVSRIVIHNIIFHKLKIWIFI